MRVGYPKRPLHAKTERSAMCDKMKIKSAFVSALVRQMWIAGLITKAELDAMEEKSKQALLQSNC